jgi:hypothetical protein
MQRGADRDYVRRITIALAAAVALHEIVAGFWPNAARQEPPDTVVAERVTIVHRPTPAPTPVPTPKPTPTVVPTPRIALTTHKFVHAAPRAAALPTRVRGGQAAKKQHLIVAPRPPVLIPVTPAPNRVAVTTSVQNGAGRGVANGGTGTGGGAGNGTGGAGGTGSGTGGNGLEPGMDTPLSPCGIPLFVGLRNKFRDGKFYEDVAIDVPLRNGQVVSDYLHWPWIYPDEDANPFSARNYTKKDERVPMQLPPPGYDLEANQKPATVLAVRHTRPDGTTDLPDCPDQKTPSRSSG